MFGSLLAFSAPACFSAFEMPNQYPMLRYGSERRSSSERARRRPRPRVEPDARRPVATGEPGARRGHLPRPRGGGEPRTGRPAGRAPRQRRLRAESFRRFKNQNRIRILRRMKRRRNFAVPSTRPSNGQRNSTLLLFFFRSLQLVISSFSDTFFIATQKDNFPISTVRVRRKKARERARVT